MKGSNLNPIDLDEPEETIDIEAALEEKRNRRIIDEAKLNKKPLDLCLAAIKTTIKGDYKHKNMTLNRAIIKYFSARVGINISLQHFHPRPDPDYLDDNAVNPKEFIVYGVDFLTTSQIKGIFNIFEPQISELIWINSSTCKIKYKSES